DSFYDKGAYFDLDAFLCRADQLVAEGADILDVGGVKAGPGREVTAEEELERVVPALEALRDRFDVPLSVDTWRASVAAAGFEVGDRGDASLAAAALGITRGCRIVRAHDVKGTRRVRDVVAAVLEAGGPA